VTPGSDKDIHQDKPKHKSVLNEVARGKISGEMFGKTYMDFALMNIVFVMKIFVILQMVR
jgi:hypothetical protein